MCSWRQKRHKAETTQPKPNPKKLIVITQNGRTNRGSPPLSRPSTSLPKHSVNEDLLFNNDFDMELSDSMSDAATTRTSETGDK